MKIDIVARIADRCGIAANGPRANPDTARIDRSESVTFGFTIDCNTPFRIGVSTRNGGMRLLAAKSDGSLVDSQGFGIQKSYEVGLSFHTDQEGLVDAGGCSSIDLSSATSNCNYYGARSGEGFSPGRRTTAVRQDGELAIFWADDDGSERRLAAGAYGDVVTVVVGPRI